MLVLASLLPDQRDDGASLIAWRETGDTAPWTPPDGFRTVETLHGEVSALAPGESLALGVRPMLLKP